MGSSTVTRARLALLVAVVALASGEVAGELGTSVWRLSSLPTLSDSSSEPVPEADIETDPEPESDGLSLRWDCRKSWTGIGRHGANKRLFLFDHLGRSIHSRENLKEKG